MTKYISPQGLCKLKEYKYVSGGYTFFDKAMQPFWEWFVTLLPMVSKLLLNIFLLSICDIRSFNRAQSTDDSCPLQLINFLISHRFTVCLFFRLWHRIW